MNINFINSLVSCLCPLLGHSPPHFLRLFLIFATCDMTFYHFHRRGWSRRISSPTFQFNIDITSLQQQVKKERRARGGGGHCIGNSCTWFLLHFSLGFGSAFRYSFCSNTPSASFFDTRTMSKQQRYLSGT